MRQRLLGYCCFCFFFSLNNYNYMSYLSKMKSPDSSFFFSNPLTHYFYHYPITSLVRGTLSFWEEVKQEILSLPNNKSCGLYSCPTQLLKCSCNIDIISPALSHIFNLSVMLGAYPSIVKISKITQYIQVKTRPTLQTIDQYLFCLILIGFLKNVCTTVWRNLLTKTT